MERRAFIRDALLLGAGVVAGRTLTERTFFGSADAERGAPAATAGGPFRAFSARSEWNRPLPTDAPRDDRSGAFIRELNGWADGEPFPHLATGSWGEPIYWAQPDDPSYFIEILDRRVRIPAEAAVARTQDAQMTVYDVERGSVVKLHRARFVDGAWKASGASIYFLGSNGLHRRLPESDDARNQGHRGFPPPIHAVRWDELEAGVIAHVLKVAIPDTAPRNVYPGAGDEGGDGSIPEGAVFRIKPSVDLARRGLEGHALTIATAMQTYGIVIGDRGGTPMTLKLENLEVNARGRAWDGVGLTNSSMASITFDDLECIRLGYHRP